MQGVKGEFFRKEEITIKKIEKKGLLAYCLQKLNEKWKDGCFGKGVDMADVSV